MWDVKQTTFKIPSWMIKYSLASLLACSTNASASFHDITSIDDQPTSVPSIAPVEVNDVVVLALPSGGSAFSKMYVSLTKTVFETNGAKVTLIGDGEEPFSLERLAKELAILNGRKKPTTLFILAHADVEPDGTDIFHLAYKGSFFEKNTITVARAADVLTTIVDAGGEENNTKYPVGIVLTQCYGARVVKKFGPTLLPDGYSIAALTPDDKETKPGDIADTMINLYNNPSLAKDLSARSIYLAHLATTASEQRMPSLYISGEGFIDPVGTLIQRQGTLFSLEERATAFSKLSGVITDPKSINYAIDFIESGNPLDPNTLKTTLAVSYTVAKPIGKFNTKIPGEFLVARFNQISPNFGSGR